MHESGIVCQTHFFRINRPVGVFGNDLSVVLRSCHAGAAPVFRIDEVSILKCFSLVIFHASVAHEERVKFVALGMRDDQIHVCRSHPLGKTVGNCLRQRARVGCPRQHDLRACLAFVLFNRDEVCERLKRMGGRAFHGENGATAVEDELRQHILAVVRRSVGQTCKGTNTDEVTILRHDRDGFKKMLTLVTVHDDSAFGLQLPGSLIDVQDHDVQAQVARGFLRGETGAERIVEEDEQSRFVFSKMFKSIAVFFDFRCFLQSQVKLSEVGGVKESSHVWMVLSLCLVCASAFSLSWERSDEKTAKPRRCACKCTHF